MALKDKFEEILQTLGNAATDLSSLDVVTLSGDINLTLDEKGKMMKPLEIAKKFQGDENGKITVEAFTHIDFDQDKIQFLKQGITKDEITYQLHLDAVKASQEARNAFLDFIEGIVRK